MLLSGCGSKQDTADENLDGTEIIKEPPKGTFKPYVVNRVRYYPKKTADGFKEKGFASWYGKEFHGRKTANGERYNMYGMTAAHKTLPMNTKLRVVNLDNGKEITVRVNDRGPFVKDRIIDLTYKGAKTIGMLGSGTARVEITALNGKKKETTEQPQEIIVEKKMGLPEATNSFEVAAIPPAHKKALTAKNTPQTSPPVVENNPLAKPLVAQETAVPKTTEIEQQNAEPKQQPATVEAEKFEQGDLDLPEYDNVYF